MKTIELNIRPGALQGPGGSPFAIPPARWKSINDYLVNVVATSRETTANAVAVIPAFAGLRGSADQWKQATLPNIIKLARGIDTFGSSTVTAQLPILQRLLLPMQSQIPAGSAGPFQDLMGQIIAAAAQSAATAGAIVSDLQVLDTTVQVIKRQAEDYISDSLGMPDAPGGGDAGLNAISTLAQAMSQLAGILSALGTPPQSDIERIRGAWANINDDLGSFRSTVADAIATTSPFIASLDLDVAIAEWSEVAAGARQFAQQASAF